MYLKNLFFKNYGPIEDLSLEMPFNQNGNPKPIIFVGENGSGKTILLSSIVDAIFEILNKLFDDISIKHGTGYNYYKVISSSNKMNGKQFGICASKFHSNNVDIEYLDKAGTINLDELNNYKNVFTIKPNDINDNQKTISDVSDPTFIKKLQNEVNLGSYFYMPANRYETPFWKNNVYLNQFEIEPEKITNRFGKQIEILSSLSENSSFLLDVLIDRNIFQHQSNISNWDNINKVVSLIKPIPNITIGIQPRRVGSRIILMTELKGKKETIINSLNKLSLGENILFNMFLNILRLSDNPFQNMDQIEGIVVIDEVDVHLHINLQKSVLPELIKMFPKVQFILTSHSPMFLLGMEETFGPERYQIIEMPNGNLISYERFSEFEKAFDVISHTKAFDDKIRSLINNGENTPILFVEGPSDITYLEKAFEIHDKKDIFEKINFQPIGIAPKNGSTKDSSNEEMHKVKNFFVHHPEATNRKLIFLFDPEENVEEEEKESKIFVIKHKKHEDNHIQRGIENNFPSELIENIYSVKKEFIQNDVHITDGITKNNEYKVKNGQKARLAEWICQNYTDKDFNLFSDIITEIEKIIKK